MSQNRYYGVAVGIIALLTLLSIAISVQLLDAGIVAHRMVELVVYALLTAFALILSVPLSRSELSIAHAIGLMALPVLACLPAAAGLSVWQEEQLSSLPCFCLKNCSPRAGENPLNVGMSAFASFLNLARISSVVCAWADSEVMPAMATNASTTI